MIDRRILICVVASLLGHFVLARSLEELPERTAFIPPRVIEVRVLEPPPPPPPEPEPPKPPEPKPPEPVPQKVVEPRVRPAVAAPQAEAPKDVPNVDQPVTAAPATGPQVFGATMESTSQAGGPAVPVGNTTRAEPTTAQPGAAPPKPLAAPAAAVDVTKMPIPQGRCAGKYTDAARAAAIEGVVILDLVVDETGATRDIVVVQGLDHGLTEAAIAAVRACRFTPGEKSGAAVAVRVRGFKIRFVLE